MTTADRARLFQLDNHDVVVVWRGDAAATLRACRTTIDHLFADEPTGGDPSSGLLQVLTLPDDARILLQIVQDSMAPAPTAPAAEPVAPPLDLDGLAALELALQRADMARFVRRRAVCAPAGEGLRLDWEKRLFSTEELMAALAPDRSARADPWLFRRLTRTLDRRMLALLSHPEEVRQAGPFSINLNVASILSAEFQRFDEALPARLRGEIILDLSPVDVVADPSAFLLAREFARMRHYALLLRDLNPMLLQVFPREEIGATWLELRWNPELAGRPDALTGADPAHVVLAQVDSPEAIAWGRSQGIARFRGVAAQPGGA